MKHWFLTFLLFLTVGTAYSQNLPSFQQNRKYLDLNSHYGRGGAPDSVPSGFIFSEGSRVNGIKNGNSINGTHNGSYRVIEEDGIHYLLIVWNDNSQDKYLIIGQIRNGYFTFFNLYNKDGIPFFNTGTIPSEEWITFHPNIISAEDISASSELREGSIVYSTNNLDDRTGVCWAARGGIGEKIIIRKGLQGDLSISTGFISYEKPYLYRQNSRPKKIRISYEGDNPKIVELADTYHFQTIDSSGFYEKDVWIEILEVYPGTRYNDTCVNFFRKYYIQ